MSWIKQASKFDDKLNFAINDLLLLKQEAESDERIHRDSRYTYRVNKLNEALDILNDLQTNG